MMLVYFPSKSDALTFTCSRYSILAQTDCGILRKQGVHVNNAKNFNRRKLIMKGKEDNGDIDENENDKEPPITLAELAQQEENANRKNLDKLLLPYKIGGAISKSATTVGWLFVISGFVLNACGYTYIVKNDAPWYQGIQIGTVEDRQFYMETRKSTTQTKQQNFDFSNIQNGQSEQAREGLKQEDTTLE